MFSFNKIIQLFQSSWSKANKDDITQIFNEEGGISSVECVLMYLYIIEHQPQYSIEFSPNHGYSTQAIAMAYRVLNQKDSFATFEIRDKFCEFTCNRLKQKNLEEYCKVIQGNALIEIPKHITDKKVQFCFIDSDHGAAFANQYIQNIFPLLDHRCLIGVHDIAAFERSLDGGSKFKTSLMGGTHAGGEEGPVRDYVSNKDYWSTHSVFGGSHEAANLPTNNELYSEIFRITGFDFRKAKSPPCPKILFFNK